MSPLQISSTSPWENSRTGFTTQHLLHKVTDLIDFGLLVCEADGQMLHANRSAMRELTAEQILKLRDGAVCAPGPCEQELAVAIRSAALHGRCRLVRLPDGEPIMLVVMPLDPQLGTASPVLIMIGRRTACTTLGLELLAIQHRLTLAEQRVLRAIVGGTASRDIATENGVAVSTVRTQIQSIRDKLGVGNIDALLLTAARLPPVPSSH